MDLKIKILDKNAVVPSYAHNTDAGLDLTATSKEFDNYGNLVYGFGIAVEIPEGYVGLIFPRSSLCKYSMAMANCVGVIDSGYRGEITAKFKLGRAKTIHDKNIKERYEIGDRIAQLIVLPYPKVNVMVVDELSATDRGIGGYGSTGK